MSTKKTVSDFNEEEKVNNNPNQNNLEIIRYSKDFKKNILQQKTKKEISKQPENDKPEKNLFQQIEIDKIKQKLKENLDSNLNAYILSTKSKEQKILELLEIINQYESQISSLNNQIKLLTNNNKQMKEILKKIEHEFEQAKNNLISEQDINKKNNTYINQLNQDKNICEKKIEELVNIINQYSGQIEALTGALNNLKKEFFSYKNQNEQDKNKIIELNKSNNILIKEKEEIDRAFNELKENYIILKQENENISEKYINLENNNKILYEQKIKFENLYEQEKNKSISLINNINQDLNSLTEYFEGKIHSMLNKDETSSIFNENKLTLNCFQTIDNDDEFQNINFEIFIKSLINGFNSFKEKIDKNKENSKEFINKEKKYKQEITQLKNKIINNEKIIENCLKNEGEIENLNKLIKIKDENIFKLKEDIKKLIQDNIKLIKEVQKVS